MTWSPETSCGFESDKIAAHIVRYTRGRVIEVGCGQRKAWPHFIGVDNGKTFGPHTQADVIAPADDLSLFATESVDAVFSSHTLEDFPEERVGDVLAGWARVIKPDGYLVLYVPSANLYPKVGEEGANPAHQWNIYPGDIRKHLVNATECGWTIVENEERAQLNEYSLFEVYQKRDDGKVVDEIWDRNPEGKSRALIIRYGAIGDQIVASSILPGLKKQAYHITYNTTPKAQEIIRHDPNIDEFLLQDEDQVPNQQLGPYWEQLQERYDKIINLCESVEGSLLQIPGRLTHQYPQEARQKIFGRVNYLERTHDIASVPYDFSPRFYPTDLEWRRAEQEVLKIKAPIVLWAINGSSPHKVYPFIHIVVSLLLSKTPSHVFLTADPGIGKELQDGIRSTLVSHGDDVSRLHCKAGEWGIRDALTFAHKAHCVVGPETGTLNAVCRDPVKKVIYLSHSSQENLTKHWVNTTVLTPDNCDCYPCHRLHYTWEHCHQDEQTSAALCASGIKPEILFEAIIHALGARKVA